MKHLVSTLFLGLILIGCQKEELDYRDIYTGNWDFEVTYTSIVGDERGESVFDCQGMIQKIEDETSMSLHHCINDYLLIKVSEDGVVYSIDNELRV